MCEAIAKYRDIASYSLRDQWIRLILRPLCKLEAIIPQVPMTVVVNTLDEFENENDVRGILQLFAEAKVVKKGRLRLFLISRSETPVRLGFGEIPEDQYYNVVLYNISSSRSSKIYQCSSNTT